MAKEIEITLVNKLQVSGFISPLTHARGSFSDYIAVTLPFKVARYVRPFQLYEEMEHYDDNYEEYCMNKGREWNIFAFEDKIECRINCSEADFKFLREISQEELVTVKGVLGNPLVKKIRNKDGEDEYVKDLQPTTLFLDSIIFHRIGKEIVGDAQMSVPDRASLIKLDDCGDIDEIIALPSITHHLIQRY